MSFFDQNKKSFNLSKLTKQIGKLFKKAEESVIETPVTEPVQEAPVIAPKPPVSAPVPSAAPASSAKHKPFFPPAFRANILEKIAPQIARDCGLKNIDSPVIKSLALATLEQTEKNARRMGLIPKDDIAEVLRNAKMDFRAAFENLAITQTNQPAQAKPKETIDNAPSKPVMPEEPEKLLSLVHDPKTKRKEVFPKVMLNTGTVNVYIDEPFLSNALDKAYGFSDAMAKAYNSKREFDINLFPPRFKKVIEKLQGDIQRKIERGEKSSSDDSSAAKVVTDAWKGFKAAVGVKKRFSTIGLMQDLDSVTDDMIMENPTREDIERGAVRGRIFRDYKIEVLSRYLVASFKKNASSIDMVIADPLKLQNIKEIIQSGIDRNKRKSEIASAQGVEQENDIAVSSLYSYLAQDEGFSLSLIAKLINSRDDDFLAAILFKASRIASEFEIQSTKDQGNARMSEMPQAKGKEGETLTYENQIADESTDATGEEAPQEVEAEHIMSLKTLSEQYQKAKPEWDDVANQMVVDIRKSAVATQKDSVAVRADIIQARKLLSEYQLDMLGNEKGLNRYQTVRQSKQTNDVIVWSNSLGRLSLYNQDSPRFKDYFKRTSNDINILPLVQQETLAKAGAAIGMLKYKLLDQKGSPSETVRRLSEEYKQRLDKSKAEYEKMYDSLPKFSAPGLKDMAGEQKAAMKPYEEKMACDWVCLKMLQDQSFVEATLKMPDVAAYYMAGLDSFIVPKTFIEDPNNIRDLREVAKNPRLFDNAKKIDYSIEVEETKDNVLIFGVPDKRRNKFKEWLTAKNIPFDPQKPLKRSIAQSSVIDMGWGGFLSTLLPIVAEKSKGIDQKIMSMPGGYDSPDSVNILRDFNRMRIMLIDSLGIHHSFIVDPASAPANAAENDEEESGGKKDLGAAINKTISSILGASVSHRDVYSIFMGPIRNRDDAQGLPSLIDVATKVDAKKQQQVKANRIRAMLKKAFATRLMSIENRLNKFGLSIRG